MYNRQVDAEYKSSSHLLRATIRRYDQETRISNPAASYYLQPLKMVVMATLEGGRQKVILKTLSDSDYLTNRTIHLTSELTFVNYIHFGVPWQSLDRPVSQVL